MKTKVIFVLVFLTLFAIIIIQNNESVPFRVFFWRFDMPKIILVPLLFFLGFVFGFAVTLAGRKSKKTLAPPPHNP